MELAGQVREKLLDIPGLTNHDVSLEVSKPEYQILVDRARAAALGVNVSQVASTVRTMVDGQVATSYLDGGYYYDVRVMVDDKHWATKETLDNIIVPSSSGSPIYLRDVASVVAGVGPVEIDRKDQARLVKATADALGRTAGEVNSEAAAKFAGMAFPEGYSWKLGGQAAMIGQEYRSLGLALALALFFAYVVLAIQFESFVQPFLIMIRVPLSLIGVAMGLFLAHTPIGTTAMIGIVVLAGIEVNHGVVLLTAANMLRQRGLSAREAIEQAGFLRLRPILMTALVGIVGMVPLALGLHEGTELLKPMAVGVMGGLVFSIFLTLLFLPALYLLFSGRRRAVTSGNATD
jgi:HAE1 family hydrophobic/amphiphilic exporter-1